MPLSAEDRLEIMDLVARYNHAHDFEDWDALVATFAPDGELVTSRGTNPRGHEQLRRFYLESGEPIPNVRHWTGNITLEGDGDRARMRNYMMLFKAVDPPQFLLTARYEDDLRRVEGRWRFQRRAIAVEQQRAG